MILKYCSECTNFVLSMWNYKKNFSKTRGDYRFALCKSVHQSVCHTSCIWTSFTDWTLLNSIGHIICYHTCLLNFAFCPHCFHESGEALEFISPAVCMSFSPSVQLSQKFYPGSYLLKYKRLACLILEKSPFNWHHAVALLDLWPTSMSNLLLH